MAEPARTAEILATMQKDFPKMPLECRAWEPLFDDAVLAIRERYRKNADVLKCIDKMEKRKDVVDDDLYCVIDGKKVGVKPSGLLSCLWHTMVIPPEAYDHMAATLIDMGTTCVQGDTHRMFASYVALNRSLVDIPRYLTESP